MRAYFRWALLLLWTGLLFGCAKASGPDFYVIEGRYLQTEDKIHLSYPGSRFRVASNGNDLVIYVTATRPDLALDMRVEKDEWETIALVEGENEIFPFNTPRVDDPSTHRWQVDLIRRNEAWQGDIIITGTDSYGILVKPSPLPSKKLLFIGDSITAGAGTTSRVNEQGEREAVSNARLAYPRVLGDRLDAQVHHVAYGGRGLTRDWQGITETNNAPQFYDRILPDNPDHLWDPQNYQADIVSVMLGTNDFNPGIPERESWTKTYQDFVARIRKDYPKAQIFLISSPMTGGEKGDALKSFVKAVAESFASPSVQYLEVSQTYGEAWDAHPTAVEHEHIADELEPAFCQALEKAGH